ncbi:hypothetical protein CSUI_011572, partial [Cystoisospora suis]
LDLYEFFLYLTFPGSISEGGRSSTPSSSQTKAPLPHSLSSSSSEESEEEEERNLSQRVILTRHSARAQQHANVCRNENLLTPLCRSPTVSSQTT